MKIIFLDIDGVLNVISQGHDEFGGLFHLHLVENLRLIIQETDAKIVISSSWRSDGLDRMQMMWEMRDLPGEVIDITPYYVDEIVYNLYAANSNFGDRGYEIAQWLYEHPDVEKYCIIDDDSDMLLDQMKYFVKTSDNKSHPDSIDIGYGLTRQCAEKVIEILNS